MNSFLTSIAGQFAKPIIISALLPVVIVFSLMLVLTYPLLPIPLSLPSAVARLDGQWQFAWVTLIGTVTSMLLYVLNAPIARLFSGYPWKDRFLGTILTQIQRGRFSDLRQQRDALVKVATNLDVNDAESSTVQQRLQSLATSLSRVLNEDFPYDEDLILPTKLGNVIRNFEDYSRKQYGVSAVPLWPRLVAVIDARFASLVDDAKTSFDFALNCLFLFCCAGLMTLLLTFVRDASGPVLVSALLRLGVFVILAELAYEAAINRARDWGSYVKAAIDLYRIDLLKKLGYQYSVCSITTERETIWPLIASQWSFPDLSGSLEELPFVPAVPSPTPPTAVSGKTDGTLKWARGVGPAQGKPYPVIDVTIRVHNTGEKEARFVEITDFVPQNWSLVWGSATATVGQVTMSGGAPVTLTLGTLAAKGSTTVSYQIESLIATT
jgi:uncharacterized repeat protein (TIGR01451 family)